MNQSTQLKLWTLLFQAFILLGMGHGLVPLALVEVAGITSLFSKAPFADKMAQALILFSFFSLAGQILVIYSIYGKRQSRKMWSHIAGIGILFFGTFYILAVAYYDSYSTFIYLSVFPFGLYIFLSFCGPYVKRIARCL